MSDMGLERGGLRIVKNTIDIITRNAMPWLEKEKKKERSVKRVAS